MLLEEYFLSFAKIFSFFLCVVFFDFIFQMETIDCQVDENDSYKRIRFFLAAAAVIFKASVEEKLSLNILNSIKKGKIKILCSNVTA